MAKVLVVDDCQDQQDFLAAVLRAEGHDTHFAANGDQALTKLQSARFHIVLTDIFMPRCDGLELIRNLRAINPHIPIVAITAGLRPESDLFKKTAQCFGANAVLDKAQPPQEIAKAIRQLLTDASSCDDDRTRTEP
jgi:CheY-like chemotaxis protein